MRRTRSVSPRVAKFVEGEDFHRLARRGEDGGTPVRTERGNAVRQIDERTRTISFVFSDGSVDRMGDTVDPAGWVLDDFLRNPVALWAHDSYSPPIGRARDVRSDGARLLGDVEFIPADTYPFAETVFRLVAGGWLNAVSVGFLPLEYSFVENDPERGWGIDFKRQQLLEISVCPIPANPNALAEARAKGVDTGPLTAWAARAARHRTAPGAQLRSLAEPRGVLAADLDAVARRRERLTGGDLDAAFARKRRFARALHESRLPAS
jgi:HK97 family phage prohead protease